MHCWPPKQHAAPKGVRCLTRALCWFRCARSGVASGSGRCDKWQQRRKRWSRGETQRRGCPTPLSLHVLPGGLLAEGRHRTGLRALPGDTQLGADQASGGGGLAARAVGGSPAAAGGPTLTNRRRLDAPLSVPTVCQTHTPPQVSNSTGQVGPPVVAQIQEDLKPDSWHPW